MQKKLIALAIAGLSSAAFAQSNVTIYGTMDATFDNVKATGATAANTDVKSRNRMTMNSSFIGFKGTEALGNGMSAVFQIESSIGENGTTQTSAAGISTGGAASTYGLAGRDTFVGLTGGFGTVIGGNITGPTRALGATMDVNAGATGIGANTAMLGKIGGVTDGAGASVFDQRISNAFAYVSPTFGGFNVTVGYMANENKSADTAAGDAVNNVTAWDTGLRYSNGPIMVGLTYETAKDKGRVPSLAGTATLQKATDTRLAAKYSAANWSAGLLWEKVKASTNAATDAKSTIWILPVTFNVTANGKIIGQYAKAGETKGNFLASNANTGSKMFTLGYEHSLSKRTILKAIYSKVTNQSATGNDFLYGAQVGQSNTTTFGGGVNGADPTGFSVGMRHSF